ncbi:MAG TPA: hypothetical protein VGB26_02505 [Nitrospiria bacterium]|jgi:hypothetical protein
MTGDEREVVENFALRQANRVLLEDLLGHDIFQKIQTDRLNEKEKSFLFQLALEEVADLRTYAKVHFHPKVNRLLENATAVQKILGK